METNTNSDLQVKKSKKSPNANNAGGVLYATPALEKGIDVLELLVDAGDGLSMADIAKKLNRSISEIFRMIVTLEKRGWVIFEADRYHLSSRMFELSHRHRPIKSLSEAAMLQMRPLSNKSMQSCHLTIVGNGRILVIAQVDAPGNLNFSVRVGSVLGLFNTASGLTFLAFLSEEGSKKLIAEYSLVADKDSMNQAIWEAEVKKVAQQGFALSTSQQVKGVTNIAYPVFGRSRTLVAALVIPYMENLEATRGPSLEETQALCAKAAENISKLLGYSAE